MLGLSERRRRRQELPFGRADVSTRFVGLVIIMMSALAALALGGAQMVLDVRGGWILEMRGQISLEIPAMDAQGRMRDAQTLTHIAEQMADAVNFDGVEQIEIFERARIEALVSPWLGDTRAQDDLPLPAILGIHLSPEADEILQERIINAAHKVDANAYVDTHQGWVQDLKRFSSVLLGAAGFMTLAVILCAMLCVSGATRAQLWAHKADIDLLHLMGASDTYIGAQFVRVVARDVGYAALLGTGVGVVLLYVGRMIAGNLGDMGFAGTDYGFRHWVSFLVLPVLVSVLCFVSARRTVFKELEKMP